MTDALKLGCIGLTQPETTLINTILRTSSFLSPSWLLVTEGYCDALITVERGADPTPLQTGQRTHVIPVMQRSDHHGESAFLKPFRAEELIDLLNNLEPAPVEPAHPEPVVETATEKPESQTAAEQPVEPEVIATEETSAPLTTADALTKLRIIAAEEKLKLIHRASEAASRSSTPDPKLLREAALPFNTVAASKKAAETGATKDLSTMAAIKKDTVAENDSGELPSHDDNAVKSAASSPDEDVTPVRTESGDKAAVPSVEEPNPQVSKPFKLPVEIPHLSPNANVVVSEEEVESYRLKRWPPVAILQNDLKFTRLASYLVRSSITQQNLVRLSTYDDALCDSFLALLKENDLLLIETQRVETVSVEEEPEIKAEKPQEESQNNFLVKLLREKLGISA